LMITINGVLQSDLWRRFYEFAAMGRLLSTLSLVNL
jgi:hypothetical protein